MCDPVCGMEVNETPWTATHAEREYRFCSAGCRALFVRDPRPYLEQAA